MDMARRFEPGELTRRTSHVVLKPLVKMHPSKPSCKLDDKGAKGIGEEDDKEEEEEK